GTRAAATQGYDVVPPTGWTMKGNMQWLQGVADNGDTVYLATSQPRPGPSVFRDELRFLESRGYVRVGDYMIPGGPGGRSAIVTPLP
ncbi:MAG TPA: hypothetical protein VG389_22680, partial [Myxococcota bacterium]|nr:hypothetical protein [Myxococcota bacterium]